MNTKTMRASSFGTAMLLSLALVACGPKTATISTTMTDFKYDPDTWTVPAGAKVTLNLTNSGSVEHEFLMLDLGTTVSPPFNEDAVKDKILVDQDVDAGQSATVVFTAPTAPGDYQVLCGVAGHLEAGMQGKLTVK
ncbi:MAG TPA: cupredoxin domain-containing protein [Anaerolineales bacterium]|nr:cupredoxin domain-containing protein [Anaerolineales bacterium]